MGARTMTAQGHSGLLCLHQDPLGAHMLALLERAGLPGMQLAWPGQTLKVDERGTNCTHDLRLPPEDAKDTKGPSVEALEQAERLIFEGPI